MFRSRAKDQMEVAGKIALVTPAERVQNDTVYAYSCAGGRTPKALWFFMIFGRSIMPTIRNSFDMIRTGFSPRYKVRNILVLVD